MASRAFHLDNYPEQDSYTKEFITGSINRLVELYLYDLCHS